MSAVRRRDSDYQAGQPFDGAMSNPRAENPHAGHRERLRARFLSEGLDAFAEHNVLELLLFYALPQKDTNELAHTLINRFGSLSGVLDASPDDLCRVAGLGMNTATLLALMPALFRRYKLSSAARDICLNTTDKAGEYLLPLFTGLKNEVVYLLCLDAKCKPLCCRQLFEGTVNAAQVNTRKVVELALTFNASSIILSHNHMSGVALPSEEDEATTKRIQAALEAVGVKLADHIIVADDDFVSMAQSGLIR